MIFNPLPGKNNVAQAIRQYLRPNNSFTQKIQIYPYYFRHALFLLSLARSKNRSVFVNIDRIGSEEHAVHQWKD